MSDPNYPPYQDYGQPGSQQDPPQYGQQPPYGQPSHGQQPTYGGQPPYGQPSYGQPEYGQQPPYGQQPTYGGQPSYGQPDYGQQPTYGGQPSQGQPSYGQPSYGQSEYGQTQVQPGYGQQSPYGQEPGYDPPAYSTSDFGSSPYGQPPRKSRSVLWISLGVVVVLAVGAAAIAVLYAATSGDKGNKGNTATGTTAQPSASATADPFAKERHASLSAPKNLAGLTKSTNKDLQKTADDLTKQMEGSVRGARDTIAAFYEDPNDKSKLVMVAGVTSDLADPDKELDGTFRGLGTGGLPVSDVKKTNAGSLGGVAKCGNATAGGVPVAVCAWADHGSVGMTFFYNRKVSESTSLFLKIRSAVLKRK
jgi:hypothetical protein